MHIKAFVIQSMFGEIGVRPKKMNVFLLTGVLDGHSAIAKKDDAGNWSITNGEGEAMAVAVKHAKYIGDLIDQYIQNKSEK